MKTRGKVLLATLSAAMLVTASVMGTLAYLQDSETVTNTFTVGKVDIVLDETGAVKNEETGTYGVDYKIFPGHTYDKDPTITVDEDSEDAWLFVKVVNGIKDIEAGTIATQMTTNGWTLVEGETNVYAYKEVVEANDEIPVFETFKIKEDVTNDILSQYGEATIEITAYAVQKDGFASAQLAWDATYGK